MNLPRLSEELVTALRSEHGWAKETIRAIEVCVRKELEQWMREQKPVGEIYSHACSPEGEVAASVVFPGPYDPYNQWSWPAVGAKVYLAAPVPTSQGDGWLPIETAPKDGSVVLLGYHNSHGNWRTMRGCWLSKEYIDEYWEDPEGVDSGWFEVPVECEDVPNCWPTDPTHWQPLPAAPVTTKEAEG